MLKNRTIFTWDNLPIMRGMNSESVDLIYLDPPFNSKHNYAAPIGSKAAGAAFKDTWTLSDVDRTWVDELKKRNPDLYAVIFAIGKVGGKSNMSYMIYMAVRMLEMHRILKNTGSIYLHCDPTMSHSLKLMMDAIFGRGNFRNEIVWRIGWISGYKTKKIGWIRNHETLLYYLRTDLAIEQFNKEYIPYPADYRRRDGKRPTGKGIPIEDTWNCSAGDVLDSIMIKSFSQEKTGYPTQKPLALLHRIIKASSNKGDMVFDPFCGCATTLVAAEKLQRQWAGIDISDKAVDLIKVRLRDEVQVGALLGKLHVRTDIPKRTDLGKLLPVSTHKQDLYGEQGGYCAGCDHHYQMKDLEIDHIIPKADGGTDHVGNLQLLCGNCNKVKGKRTMEELLTALSQRGRMPDKKA